MRPVHPIIPGEVLPVTVFAKDQPEYEPLPAHRTDDGTVLTRWKLTWRERVRILLFGDLYLEVLTFRTPLQPVRLSVAPPREYLSE